MQVLQLVTNADAPFFEQQVASLEKLGVRSEIRSPGGTHSSNQSRSPLEYARLALETRREISDTYDLVHANYGLTAPAALAQHSVPTVLSLWGSDLYGRYGPVSRLAARYSDEVIVMSREMADTLDQPCHVIPHGIDMEKFRPADRSAARAKVGWPQSEKHVLFPYDPGRELKDFPKATRVVAGVQSRFDERVTLQTLSGVDHDEMSTYYNAADAVLLTSKREGSPNVVREALACNVSVVATNVGDVSERLAGVSQTAVCETEGELVDALEDVLTGPRPQFGREVARWTSAEETGRRLKAVYEQAVDGHSSRSSPPRVASPPEV